MKLHNLIFIGMILGVVVGLGLYYGQEEGYIAADAFLTSMWWLNLLGRTMFVGALKMIIAPLILASIVAGVTSLPDMRELGSIGWKTVAYYMVTTTIAVCIGLAMVLVIQPGKKPASQQVATKQAAVLEGYKAEFQQSSGQPALDPTSGKPVPDYLAFIATQEGERQPGGGEGGRFERLTRAKDRSPADMFKEDIVLAFLMNPFQALSKSPPNALGIIFFALLLGIACILVGEPAKPVVAFFQGLNQVILRITHWLMAVAPFAIACLIAELVAKSGPTIFETLGWYCITVIAGIAVHVGVLVTIAKVIGGVSPGDLARGIREAWMVAFSTRSSAATLPVTISNNINKLKVSPKVANFGLPLGATMNMDGTALYEGVAVIFLIQIYGPLDDVGIVMTAMTTFLIFVTAVVASVGAAAVPDAGLVTMVIVANAVGLPIYYIPLIYAVDAFLDMFRTSTNILGDTVGAIVVNKLEAKRLGTPEPAAA